MPSITRVAVVGVPLAALLAGCSSAPSPNSAAPLKDDARGPQYGSAARAGGGAGSLDVAHTPTNLDQPVTPANPLGTPQGRIERSVRVAFVVPHDGFLSAFDRLVGRAADLGGFVLSSTTAAGSGGRIDHGELVVRVPADRLNDMVTGMPSSWQVSSIDFGSVDHTAETIDLTARVKAVTAHRNALQKLLDGTPDLQQITTLEQQLADVQQQLDQAQGQLDSVNNRVEMATATVSLSEKGAVVKPAPAARPRLTQAFIDGWSNAVAVVSAVTLGVFSVLPVLVLAALGLLVWRRARRPVRA